MDRKPLTSEDTLTVDLSSADGPISLQALAVMLICKQIMYRTIKVFAYYRSVQIKHGTISE